MIYRFWLCVFAFLICMAIICYTADARVENPILFIGEVVKNAVDGSPLVADANGKLASGLTVLTTGQITATQNLSTTTLTQMTSMTLTTPAAGTYLVWFDASVQTGTGGNSITVAVFLNTTTTGETRTIQFPTATLIDSGYPHYIGLQAIPVTVSGSQSINIFWSTTASAAQQSTVLNRRLTALRTN